MRCSTDPEAAKRRRGVTVGAVAYWEADTAFDACYRVDIELVLCNEVARWVGEHVHLAPTRRDAVLMVLGDMKPPQEDAHNAGTNAKRAAVEGALKLLVSSVEAT